MIHYNILDHDDGFRIDDGQGHLLFISKNRVAVNPVLFAIEDGYGVITTARSFDAYPKDAHPTDSDQVVVEIGAGLGGFIPTLARSHKWRLTVIDPFDYQIAQAMLEFAKGLELADWQRLYVEELLERSCVYLDPNRVQLVPYRLGEALKRVPSLAGSADVVVDYFGALQYPTTEGSLGAFVEDLECLLLRPGGVLIAKPIGGFPQVIRP